MRLRTSLGTGDWQFRIDCGGTFTDVVTKRPEVERGGFDKIDMQPGDCFIMETPVGGFGPPAVPKAAE
jgi:N-methylhydantoinase B/oxoprolinase/acetone carboxylase alpha subunit